MLDYILSKTEPALAAITGRWLARCEAFEQKRLLGPEWRASEPMVPPATQALWQGRAYGWRRWPSSSPVPYKPPQQPRDAPARPLPVPFLAPSSPRRPLHCAIVASVCCSIACPLLPQRNALPRPQCCALHCIIPGCAPTPSPSQP